MFRYFIGIKEIKLHGFSFTTEGEAITYNLNDSGKELASVDIHVNETVPEGTAIQYFFSTDRTEWIEVVPTSRHDVGELPRRVVFNGFEAVAGDMVVDQTTDKIFLRILMTSSTASTPVLKSYAVRLKLL